ncbi:amidohydrolase [Salinicoccus albus]|uniref:amidohydrolase n=1 Tax=Salinicoccus albus TaxID=418756 RepID=UPI0003704E28|nr:amidohydrolase [Salinicoccus albus]
MKNATLLFKNANVLTLDKQNTRAGSVAVAEGEIIGIWQESEPPKNAVGITDQTDVIDLNGDTLIPGFIDTHNHILMYALMKDMADCSTPPNKTIEDILDVVGQKVQETPAGEWIQGYGYDDTLLEDQRHPTQTDLDKAAPNHPVLIKHISGHLAVANSYALKLAGLDADTPDPQGGHYGREENGQLNGVLYEHEAMAAINNLLPQKSEKKMIELLSETSNEYLAQGITTNSDAAVYSLKHLNVHLEAARHSLNPMRTQLMIKDALLRDDGPLAGYTHAALDEEIRHRSNGLARLDSAKMFQDGSIQGLTGALRKPYYQNPELYGDLIHKQDVFQEEVLDLHQRGFRVTTHGNGDRAIGSILDAYEYALNKSPNEDHRHRIEHVQSAVPEDLARMEALRVAGSFFINHVYYWGDRHEQIFLGPERARRISPLKEAVDHHLLFTIHSDCPITPISPLFSVWAAANRITREGKVLGPEQRIEVITALKSMTIYAADLIFQGNRLGSIEKGKRADFAILSEDPVSADPERIKDITVKSTFIDGEPVYGQSELVTS